MQRKKVSAEKRIKVRALAERPGTPAEGEAAKAALERMGSGDSKVTTATEPNKRKLSEIFIQKLKPRPRPFLVWDTYQRGLALATQPTGHKSWKCIYSMHGRPRWYSIGDASAIGLSDARKLASRVMFKVAEGKDPCADRKAERSKGTFEELATEYCEAARTTGVRRKGKKGLKPNKSWAQADALVRKHLLPKWGKLQAAAVTKTDVKAMMARIDAPILANQVLAAASAIFTWAIHEEKLTVNPCQLIDRNNTNDRDRVLSDSEVPKFWKAFDSAGLVASTALKMILLLGQRPGEVAAMRREHIEDGWWTLPGEELKALDWPGTKNGNTHRVWLPAPALALLADMPETGLVFAGPRGGSIKKLDDPMRDICTNLGIVKPDKVTPHDLRRTHGSTITGMGFGREAMNRVQNHKEGGIADVYDRHEYADENKRIMEAVAARIMALVEGGPAASNVFELQAART
jgi:integrase